jgi:spore photoproduct lyase
LNHRNRTVVAWSLNPEAMIRQNEFKTASLTERLEAAVRVCGEGYQTAFHFDPMIAYPGWREGYRQVVEMLFDYIRPANIAWISFGTLRFLPTLKQIVEERFPRTTIFCHEFILAEDKKMRYLKRIRREMLKEMAGWLRRYGPNIPQYLCMEKPSLWSSVFPDHPHDADALERYLSTRCECLST